MKDIILKFELFEEPILKSNMNVEELFILFNKKESSLIEEIKISA